MIILPDTCCMLKHAVVTSHQGMVVRFNLIAGVQPVFLLPCSAETAVAICGNATAHDTMGKA